jgi:AcrR family transcriptional regulator
MHVHRMRKRRYTLGQRAEGQEETRRRIINAVLALHRQVGPARTTVSAIAAQAGVERLTVYRHFADDTAIFAACSARFSSEVPPPDPATWKHVKGPAHRLRAALLAFYDYYGRGQDMLAHVERDAPRLPALAAVLSPWFEFVAVTRAGLLKGWTAQGRRRTRLAATISHALRFDTWQSLARDEALGDADAAELMVALATAAARMPPPRPQTSSRRGSSSG